jgi:5'-nucleotidase
MLTALYIQEYQKSFPAEIVLGQTETEWNLTKDVVRRGEATICNLVNDLMRTKFNVDIVLNNAGAFRGGRKYPPGPVTDKMLKEIDEFSNYAYMLDIEGRHLKAILERSAASFDEGGFLHPAGIRYTVDLRQTAQKIDKNASKALNLIRKGKRVSAIVILDADGQWQPLEADKIYRVLSNSYLVNQQGDGYFWFKRYGRNLKNTYSTFYSIMAEFIDNKGVLNPGKSVGFRIRPPTKYFKFTEIMTLLSITTRLSGITFFT